jgi:lactate dehydrogenase-like 2-hydroxyacid dehydrogenase
MQAAKIDVLEMAQLLPSLMEALERKFKIHKFWLAADRVALLKEHGESIRGMVTVAPAIVDAELLGSLPQLEIIARFGVGLDAIDVEAAIRRGIIITNTPRILDDCVADTALALMLAVSRRVCEADRFIRAGEWSRRKFPLSTKVTGKTCGIVGLGNIGEAIAARARGFDMQICYHNRRCKPGSAYQYYDNLEAMARDVDYLVLVVPGGDETYHMIDARILSALGPKGFLINVARGSVVDQAALIEALNSGGIAGAGLDVFEGEPNVPVELRHMDNVVMMPHVASGTNETREAMGKLVLANLEAHFGGKPVLTPVLR